MLHLLAVHSNHQHLTRLAQPAATGLGGHGHEVAHRYQRTAAQVVLGVVPRLAKGFSVFVVRAAQLEGSVKALLRSQHQEPVNLR